MLQQVETTSLPLESARIASEVTIGISAFCRPDCVERLVASIRRYYPTVQIVIGDNGDKAATVDDEHLTYLTLPFDCGLSATRNAIADHVQTPYLLLCDDDFVFTSETRILDFLSVLDAEPGVGVVGGMILDERPEGDLAVTWAMDLDDQTGELIGRAASAPTRYTSDGVSYYPAETILNFALFRREMLAEHPWDESLKVHEHWDYYLSVKLRGRYRVACADQVRCIHRRVMTADYQPHRARPEFQENALKKWGLSGVSWPNYDQHPPRDAGHPNIVVLGVGHSGTSIITRAIHSLGWRAGDADHDYSESVSVRAINQQHLAGKSIDPDFLSEILLRMPTPWAIKDPRFVQTLDCWMPYFESYRPLLLWLTRESDAVKASYARRNERFRGESYEREYEMCHKHFVNWPWQKLRVDFETILNAASLIDPQRPLSS